MWCIFTIQFPDNYILLGDKTYITFHPDHYKPLVQNINYYAKRETQVLLTSNFEAKYDLFW